jgi:F-type H+-transporting ATPase subunit a
MVKMKQYLTIFSFLLSSYLMANPIDNEHNSTPVDSVAEIHATTLLVEGHDSTHPADGHSTEAAGKYNPTDMILNHIGNSNEFHLFDKYTIPLPCILYSKQDGLKTFMSSIFHHGTRAHDRYVTDHGVVRRILDESFPMGDIELETKAHEGHAIAVEHEKVDGEEIGFVSYQGKKYQLEKARGLLTSTSFFDFSITKNVFTMLLASIFLIVIMLTVASTYKKREGQAPKGLQNFVEPIIQFIRDDVAVPMLGDKYMTYFPFLLTIFFFILTCNLFGLIPLFPFGANTTGNIATTGALALITFIVVNLNGKKDYWKHIFWMPNVPVPMKIFLAPIELIGVFTKPISLMIRLFANITAGHIIILALVGLIFVFGNAGQSIAGAGAGIVVAIPFTMFLNVIELIVALIQAFIFTILTASYIGAATEEHHHDEAH